MTGRRERRSRSKKDKSEEVKIEVTPTLEPPKLDLLKIPGRGDSPRDFRSLHREKSPFEIGEKPDVQVASQKAIIDKALVMDISGGVTNVDEYISLFFTDACTLDPASCGDISTVQVVVVEEDVEPPEPPKPAEEHERPPPEVPADLPKIEEEAKDEGKSEAEAPPPEEVPPEEPPVEEEEEEEEEEESEPEPEPEPPREPTPPPPPPKEPTPEPIKPAPEPEYDSDVELIPVKEDFDPSVWTSIDNIEQHQPAADKPAEAAATTKSREGSRKQSIAQEMTERERDLEWQRQRQMMRPPLIISHLKSRAAPKGSTVKLTCTISGPGITVRWFKNGDPVEKSSKHTFKVTEGLLSLEIKDIDFIDAGEYSCNIKNKNGETSTSTSVTVYENFETKPTPPTFISIKDDLTQQEVPEPKEVTDAAATHAVPAVAADTAVAAVAEPPPLVPEPAKADEATPPSVPPTPESPAEEPKPEEVKVEGDAAKPPLPAPEQKVEVPAAPAPSAEPEAPAAPAKPATAAEEPVEPPPPEAPSEEVPYDEAAAEAAAAAALQPKKKRGPEKSPSPPPVGGDMARYYHKKILHQRDKLQWSVHLTNRAVVSGIRVKLMCAATGFEPNLEWYKDGKLIEYDDHIADMNDLHRSAYACIWINDVTLADQAEYKCRAFNEIEAIETTCQLTVVQSPAHTQDFAPTFVRAIRENFDPQSNILTVEFVIRANPSPTITWHKGMIQLGIFPDTHLRLSQHFDETAEHTIASLVFYDPSYTDSGEYICNAKNSVGEATCKYNMNFRTKEQYFEWLAKKRPGWFKAESILHVDKPYNPEDDVEDEDEEEEDEEEEASGEGAAAGSTPGAEGAEKEKAPKVAQKPSLPKVPEVPEDEAAGGGATAATAETPAVEAAPEAATAVQEKQKEPAAEEILYVRKKTKVQLDIEELERRQKFDFVSHLPNVRVQLGKTIRLMAYVKCPEEVTSRWKRNGLDLQNGLRLTHTTMSCGTCIVEIEKCKYRDAGCYTCVAKSEHYGEIEQSCNVSIYETKIEGEPPIFTKPIKETYDPIGDELTLECCVRGDPMPETVWIIHGVFYRKNTGEKYYFRKFDDGTQQLKISMPQKEDSGRFVCRAINTVDKTDMVHYLNYKNSDEDVLKEIEDEMHKRTAKPIRSRHLRAKDCDYNPEDDALIRWSEMRHKPEKEYDYRYKLHFITKLQDKTVAEGTNLKFTSYVDGKFPQFMWYKDDMPIVQGRKYRQKARRDGKVTLEVVNVTSEDAGVYKIEARNYAGVIESKSIVSVYKNPYTTFVPPIFASNILETYSLHSDEIVLECRVRGTPRPNIAWIKDGEYIIPGDKYEQYDHADGTCKLIITRPTEDDSGTYTCEAESGGCSDAISHNVQFVSKEKVQMERTHSVYHRNPNLPHFYQGLADYSIPSGGNICLVVEVQGNCEVQWFREKIQLHAKPPKIRTYSDGTGLFALCITAATMDASGRYTCRAINAFGKAESSSNVDIINPNAIKGAKPPIFMSRPQPEIKIRQGDSLSMAFKIIGDPKPKIQWMKGTKDLTNLARTVKEVHNDYIRFSIKEAVVSDEGAYFIVVRNRYGIDRAFTKVSVKPPRGYKKDKDIEDHIGEQGRSDKGRK